MKDAVPQSLDKAEVPAEHRSQQNRAAQLQADGAPQDKARPPDDAAHLGRGNGLLHHVPLGQADAAAPKPEKGQRHGDDAQTADLNQNQNDELAPDGPVGGRVLDHQAGDAGRGNGGKQGFGEGRTRPGTAANRQRQNQPAQQDHGQKAQKNDLEGGSGAIFFRE